MKRIIIASVSVFILILMSLGAGPACIGNFTEETTESLTTEIRAELGNTNPEYCFTTLRSLEESAGYYYAIFCDGHSAITTKYIGSLNFNLEDDLDALVETIAASMNEVGFEEVATFQPTSYSDIQVFRRAENAVADPAQFALVISGLSLCDSIGCRSSNEFLIYIENSDVVQIIGDDVNLGANYMTATGYEFVQRFGIDDSRSDHQYDLYRKVP